MRKIDENRAKNYIKKHERYEKWLVFALCVSLLTGTATLYGLNKPATAMTEEALDQVGIVIPTADAEFEQELIELTQENKESKAEEEKSGDVETAEESASEEKASEDADGDAEAKELEEELEEQEEAEEELKEEEEVQADAKSVKLTVRFVDMDGAEIKEEAELNAAKELEFGEGFEELVDGYFYNGAFFGDKEIAKITPVFDEKASEEDTQEPAEVTVAGFDIEAKDGEVITVNEDAEISYRYLKACEETEFAYSDNKVNVKIVTTGSSVFPEGIELKVNEVTPETSNYNYDAYMEALNENADSIANDAGQKAATQYTESNTLLYDIAFIYEGKEIQPKEGSVVVTMEFMEQQLTSDLSAQSESDVAVVHLPIREEVKETAEIATTEEATDITSGDIKVETLADASAEVGGTEKVEFTSDSFSVYAVITYQDHEPGTDTFKSVLGDAVNFGIVSEEIHVSESETNFAVKRLVASGQSGNDMTNPVEQTFIVSEADISQVVSYNGEPPKFTIKGEKAYFMVPYDSDVKDKIKHQNEHEFIIFDDAYSQTYLEQIVDDMLTYTRAASADLKTREDNAVIETDKNDKDRYMVDLTKEGYDVNGTYYVTLSDDEYKNISQDQKLYIYKTSGQTIVFNVPQSGDVSIHKFMVSTDGAPAIGSDTLAGNKKDPVARTIIWNFENADNVYTGGGIVGVFIAGKENATWYNTKTTAGWIAFPTVKITAEFHNTYDEIQQISGAVQLEAYKNIDGEPAKASGFKFKLAVTEWGSGIWRDLEVISNEEDSPHNIIFDSITFGGDKNYTGDGLYQYVDLKNEGDSKDFVFAIDEVEGTTDSQGNVYNPDGTVYFAAVTVTLQKLNEHTNTLYYKVSQPVYYTNFDSPQLITDSDRPVFNNTTKKGSVGLKIYKYLNGADPEKYQFTFTVRKLVQTGTYISDGTTYPACHLETVKNNLTNNGKNISDELEYTSKDYVMDEHGSKHVYYVITENPGSVNSGGIQTINDTDYIFVRIDNPEADNPIVNYYKVKADNINCQRIEDTSVGYKYIYVKAICNGSSGFAINPENYAKDLAFYNTGTSMLRIHKMVVNDFGSDFVRDNVNSILNSVKFRITNNTTGNYIILRGFAAAEGTLSSNHLGEKAKEYDVVTHNPTGREFEVVCNGNAQWTILGIDIGTYTVEEVADGFTFVYDTENNVSRVIMETPYSRVTKYAVTDDDEEKGLTKYGAGGENFRKVFSADVSELKDLSDKGPQNVKVGDISVPNDTHTETVQVCNYYSKPIGPIQVTKNLIGGTVNESTEFKFTLAPIGFTVRDSAGNNMVLPSGDDILSQPMPTRVEMDDKGKIVSTSVDPTATVTLDKDTSAAVATFESIPFRFEGTYYYTITEENTGINGIKYDPKTYYVEVVVEKKYTQFIKDYTYEKGMTHPAKYTEYTKIDNEDFYYLGANIRYATDDKFQNVVAECELYLGYNPNTGKPDVKEFQIAYKEGTGVNDVAFNNEITGNLTVIKKWLDKDSNLNPENHTELSLYIQNRVVGTDDWNLYKEIKLSSGNLTQDRNWKYVETNLPLIDESGNPLEYRVVEPDSYRALYSISYSYNGTDYYANQCDNDPDYAMRLRDGDDGSKTFGEVTITNKTVTINELPSTGGMGTAPLIALGALLISMAVSGFILYKKKETI